jgi:hypothetical protein
MTDQHITPPPELRNLWAQQAQRLDPHDPIAWLDYVATRAAQWGADQELEACCEWVSGYCPRWPDGSKPEDGLRAARRPSPKTRSLKEQAIQTLELLTPFIYSAHKREEADTIRRALEALPND